MYVNARLDEGGGEGRGGGGGGLFAATGMTAAAREFAYALLGERNTTFRVMAWSKVLARPRAGHIRGRNDDRWTRALPKHWPLRLLAISQGSVAALTPAPPT